MATCWYCHVFYGFIGRCNKPLECDCPKCQGMCECGEDTASAHVTTDKCRSNGCPECRKED